MRKAIKNLTADEYMDFIEILGPAFPTLFQTTAVTSQQTGKFTEPEAMEAYQAFKAFVEDK